MIAQGDVWWAELGEPIGAEPGFRRPVVVIQCDRFIRIRMGTALCVAMTSQLKWSSVPGNVLIRARDSGLDRDSVANISQVANVNRSRLLERVGHLPAPLTEKILDGVCRLIGR